MSKKLVAAIREHSLPLTPASIDQLIEAVGDAEIVMLGEATHGTSEFYKIRTSITQRLIQEKGFVCLAVEGDWPSAQAVNRYIKGYDNPDGPLQELLTNAFNRWPAWMWANEEVASLVSWLRSENEERTPSERIGFYGIDLYSLYESIDEVLQFLKENESFGVDLEMAKKAFSCFEPYNRMPEHYALSTAHFSGECIREVTDLLATIRQNERHYSAQQELDLNVEMNALVAKNAEAYYRAMLQDDAASWNIRDQHMFEAIEQIKQYYGAGAKIIVWEHNTHIGDASETSMKQEQMVNVGQLVREKYGRDRTFAVGFGTYEGTVIAADSWGVPFEVMQVPPAKFNTWEGQMHAAGSEDKLLIFTEENRHRFNEWIGHRAIGVVYNPEFESFGNYVPSRVGSRYDVFLYIDRTNALHPFELS